MPKTRVAMYGLSSEGYRLAGDLADKALVTVVDEMLQMAMDMDQTFLKRNPRLQELMEEESLLSFKPIEQVLGDAEVIFFTPKFRRLSDETLVETGSKLRDLSKHLNKGVTLVNTLPTGPGGNSENIMVVEKQTGLQVGSTLTYAYMPLRPGDSKPAVVASTESQQKDALSTLGFQRSSQNIFSAELEYVSTVMEGAVSSVIGIEMARRAREAKVALRRESGAFIDEFASCLYELKAIQASEETGESMSYLAGAALKSFENYVRYVVDETREVLREKQLKASRTKITLLWTLDKYEMRGERLQVAESIQQRLKDYVTEVEILSGARLKGGPGALDPLKHNVLIVCSKQDQEALNQLRKSERGVEMTEISATPGLGRE